MSTLYIGVDPGLHGAIAFLHGDNMVMEVFDLPTNNRVVQAVRHNKEDGTKRQVEVMRGDLDAYELSRMIKTAMLRHDRFYATLELVGPRDTDSNVGAAAFVGVAKEIRGVIKAHMIPCQEASPQKWRRALGIPKPPKRPPLPPLPSGKPRRQPQDKTLVVAEATRLWPGLSHRWKAKCHADLAEACLIAYYTYKDNKS